MINDLFGMVASAFVEDDPGLIVSDFQKTFYPEGRNRDPKASTDGFANVRPDSLSGVKFEDRHMDDGYKSFDTFGGDKGIS